MTNVVPIAAGNRPVGWRRRRWDWVTKVRLDADLPISAKLVAHVLIALPQDSPETPIFKTNVEALAASIACGEGVVKRALRSLEDAGYIQRSDGRGRGRQLTICFVFPAAENQAKSDPLSDGEQAKSDPFNETENGSNVTDFNGNKGSKMTDFREENGSFLNGKWVKNGPPPRPPYKDTISFPNKNAGEGGRDAPNAGVLEFWAEKINAGGFVPVSAVGPEMARQMLQKCLVTEAALRAKGIAY